MNAQVVAEKVQMARATLHFATLHHDELLLPWTERLFLGQAERFSTREVFDEHIALLERTIQALERAHIANMEEAADDPAYRAVRDEASQQLARVILDARGLLDAAYGSDILVHYQLSQPPPGAGEALLPFATEVVRLLRERAIEERSPFGFDLDLAPIADRIERTIEPLRLALIEVRREAQELRQTVDALRQALTLLDEVHSAVSELLHAICLLARRPDLAAMLQSPL